MKIECPCRLGERFSYDGAVMCKQGRFVLTGLDFFAWSTPGMSGVTLCAKRDPEHKDENTRFYDPKDPAEGVRIALDIPEAMIRPGYPLRELGLDTDAVGHLQGLGLTKDGWEYHIYFGKYYGGPRQSVRTEKLDELFKPVLPLQKVNWPEWPREAPLEGAVQVDLKNYLI